MIPAFLGVFGDGGEELQLRCPHCLCNNSHWTKSDKTPNE
jgi:hypothetical protein